MAITDHTRKVLWGRSGNRCAMCKQRLVVSGTAPDPDAVIGDECHIVAQATGGARAGFLPTEQLDQYSNLLLLCKVDHKRIDDQPAIYTIEKLRTLKADHELWVENTLEVPVSTGVKADGARPVRIERIQTGKELLALVENCLAFHIDHPEPEDEEEAEIIAGFAGQVQDWSDIHDDIDAGERIRVGFGLTSLIRTIETYSLTIWGGRYSGSIVGGVGKQRVRVNGMISIVVVRRDDRSHVAAGM